MRDEVHDQVPPHLTAGLDALLAPRAIALVGVSPDPEIIRGRMLESIQASGFDGPLHLVSRSHASIHGRACITSADALPEGVDLAIITVPAPFVVDALAACARRGVRAAVIISSGFAEEGQGEGVARQQRIAELAREHRMTVLGPNAEGFLNSFTPLVATFSPVVRNIEGALVPPGVKADPIAVTSQSGGIGFAFFNRGHPRRLPFGYVVSMGNEADAEGLDVMDHVLDDARIGVGLMFLEGLKTPAKLARVARKAMTLGKPLVIAKMGRSAEGAAAAAAHTSSLAGTYRAHQAMFRHLGITAGDDLDQTLDAAAAFSFLRHKLPAGRRVAVLTPSGGAGIWLTDACVAAGLAVPELDAGTRRAFDALLPSYGSSRNPVDLTAQFIFNRGYAEGIDIVSRSPCVDAVMVASSLTRRSAVEHEYQRLVQVVAGSDKPVMFWSYTLPHRDCVELLAAAGIPCYTNLTGATRAMAALADYRVARERVLAEHDTAPARPVPATPLPVDRDVLCEYELAPLLRGYGIPVHGTLTANRDEAVRLAVELAVPVALKVQSPAIPHKSEAGAVALNVSGASGVAGAFDAVLASARRYAPMADIHGVLVQPMAAPGVEMILGLHRDPGFGLMMLVGAGGVLVELMQDSVLAPPPRDADAAQRMLEGLASRKLLDGLRGAPPADAAALVELMLCVARFAREHAGAIESLDLNPVIVHPRGEGVSVVDALLYRRRA